MQEILRAILSRNPPLRHTLEFLFPNPAENLSFAESLSFQNLRIQPLVGSHRNLVTPEPFVLLRERVGGSQDVPMVPLVHGAVDEALRSYAATRPHFLDYVGKTPISPYGSMGLSVSRWGYIDWDYIRDLDWRIFLPPEIGQLSGFKSELERILTRELHKYDLHTVLGGKDDQGLSQVQLRDIKTSVPHGFHFFLIAMKPGFVRGSLHHDGGYSPHFSYFPEHSIDEHLESASLLWSDVVNQQREDYIVMFNQLSFNIWGENTARNRMYKTKGWYLHKAFKWYATLARMRGLSSLEEDLLYEYEHFRGSEVELSYFARYRYYSRMIPSALHLDAIDRELARAASIDYARARHPQDPLVGQRMEIDIGEIVLLEPVPQQFAAAARRHCEQAQSSLPAELKPPPIPGHIRFADNLAAPSDAQLDKLGQVALIPAEWSMVFCDSYVGRVTKKAAEESRPIPEPEVRQALAALLAALLSQRPQAKDDFSGSAYI